MTTPRAAEGRMRMRLSGRLLDLSSRATLGAAAFLCAAPAWAAGSSMPWEAPLQSILESIEGPVAKIVAVIVIIVTGLSLAFGESSGGFRRLIQIVFGLSIAFAASSFFLSFFSFGGGALIAEATSLIASVVA
jgi:type IV secretory pathway VirB2 component (pilin)